MKGKVICQLRVSEAMGPLSPDKSGRVDRRLQPYLNLFEQLGLDVIFYSRDLDEGRRVKFYRQIRCSYACWLSQRVWNFSEKYLHLSLLWNWWESILAVPWVICIRSNQVKYLVGMQLDPVLVRAGNILGVTSIEIFHGYGLTNDHWFYGRRSLVRKLSSLPSVFVTLDERSASVMREHLSQIKADSEVMSCKTSEMTPQWDADSQYLCRILKEAKNEGKLIILVSLQWKLDTFTHSSSLKDDQIPPRIVDVIVNLQKLHGSKFLFLIRPHQMSWRCEKTIKRLELQAKSLGCLFDNTRTIKFATPYLDLNFTLFSSIVRELALDGIPSFLFCVDNRKLRQGLFDIEVEYGMVRIVNEIHCNEVVDLIFNYLDRQNNFSPYFHEVAPRSTIEEVFHLCGVTEDS